LQLLRETEVETSADDHIFAHSRAVALSLIAVPILASVTLAFFSGGRSKLAYYIATVFVAVLLLTWRFISARFRSSNWLARTNTQGVFVHFRSYLNYHLSAQDLTVVFIPYAQVRGARQVRQSTRISSPDGASEVHTVRYVELELTGDTSLLREALATEASRSAPRKSRWYGTSSTLYQDFPVGMSSSSPFLRMAWSVVPGPASFLAVLPPETLILESSTVSQDFTHLGNLTPEDQRQHLRELVQRGETIAAIQLARNLYGYGLAEARDFVTGLAGRKSSTA